jgi:hypothetical protein
MWWHPLVVLLAWIRLYRKCPKFYELVAIVFHDIGYWGCKDMDGECGMVHPVRGATLSAKIVRGLHFLLRPLGIKIDSSRIFLLCLLHSSALADDLGAKPSKLCGPDKLSVLFEPWWFYSLRARLAGELDEYVGNGPLGMTPRQWFYWLRERQKEKYEQRYPRLIVDGDGEQYSS